jgi:competence ComEA-like helix-hairpin-helix protein
VEPIAPPKLTELFAPLALMFKVRLAAESLSMVLANAIVAYRESHGLYDAIEDIKKIQLIDEKLFNKISPYLTL